MLPLEVDEFRDRARSWIAANKPHAPRDYGAILPIDLYQQGVDWQRRLYDEGWAGIHWPTRYGGQGLTHEHNAVWIEECALAGVPPFINMVGIVLAGGCIQLFGTDAHKDRHLRQTLHADQVWCQLFSEPGAGSDLAGLSTRAVRDGDRYIVNGQKVWCSGGRYSDWGILMARTNPDVAKHKGISFFLLDMRLPGIETRPLKQMTGEAEFDEVFFTDVEVPAESLIGPEHEGWNVGMAVLTNERGHIGASVIGLERRLEHIKALSTGSGRTGSGDTGSGGTGHGGPGPGEHSLDALGRQQLAELLSRGKAYTAMGKRQGAVASTAASLMKLGITEMMFDAAALRADLAGADALLWDEALATGLLAAPGGRIAGGTTQVQKGIIGERLLGLPKEPKG